jgi:UDP-N-acetylmuramoylalanine--D-glutamate ligase
MEYKNIQTLKEFESFIKNKTVSVVGIGKSNIPLIGFLRRCGAKKITARDKRDIFAEGNIPKSEDISYILGENYLDDLYEDVIFKSPGIRRDLPCFLEASNGGSLMTSEMELFFLLCPAFTIAVTGSAGKTTTTTIIGEILKASGKTVHVGGNIGEPLLSKIENIKKGDYAVLELSSFQLFDLDNDAFAPNAALVTNIAPNHLDWHRDMGEYANAKKTICKNQKESDRVILNYGDESVRSFGNESKAEKYFFSMDILPKYCQNGVYRDKEAIVARCGGEEKTILKKSDIAIPGEHNVLNFMAAIAATHDIAGGEAILEVAKTFAGVEHRIEFAREHEGVRYYNSSIDSSPTRTITALDNFKQNRNIVLILGGSDKKIAFDPLAPALHKKAKAAVLYGDTKEKIKKCLDDYKKNNENCENLIVHVSDSFDEAVKKAKELANSGDIVLLSPACASFGDFKNFEERGNRFKELVNMF